MLDGIKSAWTHTKKVNKNLVFNVYNSNTDRPENSTFDSNNTLNKLNSLVWRTENYAFS